MCYINLLTCLLTTTIIINTRFGTTCKVITTIVTAKHSNYYWCYYKRQQLTKFEGWQSMVGFSAFGKDEICRQQCHWLTYNSSLPISIPRYLCHLSYIISKIQLRGAFKKFADWQSITRCVHHILSLFHIISCNWNALSKAYLQSSDSIVEQLQILLFQPAICHAGNVFPFKTAPVHCGILIPI